MQLSMVHKNRKGSKLLAYALVLCMVLSYFAMSPMESYAATTDAYLQNGVGLDNLTSESGIVLGSASMTSGSGFLGNYAYISNQNISALRNGTTTTATLGLGDSWSNNALYSSGEDHGVPTWIYHRVSGLDLKKAFAALGVTNTTLALSIKATDGYSKSLDNAFAQDRYYFDQEGTQSVTPASPMLILKRNNIENTVAPTPGAILNIPTTATTAVDPIFAYGQQTVNEHSNCNWVQDTNKVVAGPEGAAQTALTVVTDGGNQAMSIWEIIRQGVYSTNYTYQKAGNDLAHHVKGIPLDTLLAAMGVTIGSNEALEIKTSDNWAATPISYADLGKWFVAYDGDVNGTAIDSTENETALRLYGPGQFGQNGIVKNLTTLTVIDQSEVGLKQPYQAGDDISKSVFYIGVETAPGGPLNYYYYTKQELKNLESTANFAYNDHSVKKTVTAKGAPLLSLLNNITGAAITNEMIIQYAEQDGYHAAAAEAIDTTLYKDKVAWLKGTHVRGGATIANAQTMISYEIHEEYQTPDANNQNDGTGVYKDADNNSGYLRAYRNSGSNNPNYIGIGDANETVIKYLMGVVVSYSGSVFKGDDGYIQKTLSDKNASIAVAAPVTITGLMPGMKFAAKAPAVVNATLKSGTSAYQMIDVVEGAAQSVTFAYTEAPYFYVKNGTATTNYTYTDMVAGTTQVPAAADYGTYTSGGAVTAVGDYGFSAPMYYRYNGSSMSAMLAGIGNIKTITVTATDGSKTTISAADASKYFVAYSSTQSKSSTNTSEGKRVTKTFDNPKLIMPGTGKVVTSAAIKNSGASNGKNVTVAVESVEGVTVNFFGGGSSDGYKHAYQAGEDISNAVVYIGVETASGAGIYY